MFAAWGRIVYHARHIVLLAMVLFIGALGLAGAGLEDRLSQSGWDDPKSDSVTAAKLEEEAYGRDARGDVVVLVKAPPGSTVDDPALKQSMLAKIDELKKKYPDVIRSDSSGIISYWAAGLAQLATPDKSSAVFTIPLKGEGDDILRNYRKIADDIRVPGVEMEIAGQQPVALALDDGMKNDLKRAEIIALPVVGILLFFVFGGLVAAGLPLLTGVMSIIGSLGVLSLLTRMTDVNAFAQSVVTLIGLGLAIDYALFIVSRFREEMAEGRPTEVAVQRTVATAGRTVVFSAVMVAVSLSGLLIFPQGFLKSVAYGAIAAITLAAVLSITVLPAVLAILGPRVDALGLRALRKTRTRAEIENGIWGRIPGWSMRHPVLIAVPIILVLLGLIIPFKNISFGGISEDYLPPSNQTRLAQEHFDAAFPDMRTNPVKIIVVGDQSYVGSIREAASKVDGITGPFSAKAAQMLSDGKTPVAVLQTGLRSREDAPKVVESLRAISVDDPAVSVYVGGTPALEQDSINALLSDFPVMGAYVVLAVTILMFLAFGSLVLPVKATLMSLLGLGATLGVLTWIFIDGHGSGMLNFSPGPLMSPVLVLIMVIIFGLSTDYEVFLVSRMVEARSKGATTEQAIRFGTAHTGRIITAAAAILIVVTGAFGFSEIVMMKYIAYGMIAALILDATIIRLLLVPATMKLLSDDCWWAPAWLKRIQRRIGLQEHEPEDDHVPADAAGTDTPDADPLTEAIPRIVDEKHTPDRRPPTDAIGTPESRRRTAPGTTAASAPIVAPLERTRMDPSRPRPAPHPHEDEDPTPEPPRRTQTIDVSRVTVTTVPTMRGSVPEPAPRTKRQATPKPAQQPTPKPAQQPTPKPAPPRESAPGRRSRSGRHAEGQGVPASELLDRLRGEERRTES